MNKDTVIGKSWQDGDPTPNQPIPIQNIMLDADGIPVNPRYKLTHLFKVNNGTNIYLELIAEIEKLKLKNDSCGMKQNVLLDKVIEIIREAAQK